MATMIQTPRHVLNNAVAELGLLDRKHQELHTRLQAIQAEQNTIAERQRVRADQLSALQATARELGQQYDAIATEARLLESTIEYGSKAGDLKAAEKERDKATRALTNFEAKAKTEEDKDQARASTLAQEYDACMQQLASAQAQREAVLKVQARAHETIGQEEYARIAEQFQALQGQLASREHAVQDTQAELERYLHSASMKLQEWPDLQAQIKHLVLYRDSTTSILEAALHLIDTLIKQAPGALIDDAHVMHLAQIAWLSVPELLSFDPAQLYPAFRGEPVRLIERREMIERLLVTYREMKQSAS